MESELNRNIKTVFGMFERLDVKQQYEGTGIRSRHRSESHWKRWGGGGVSGVESDGINGSKFWIQLPTLDAA